MGKLFSYYQYNQIINAKEDPKIDKRFFLNLIISAIFTVWNKLNAWGNEETKNANLLKENPLKMILPKTIKILIMPKNKIDYTYI